MLRTLEAVWAKTTPLKSLIMNEIRPVNDLEILVMTELCFQNLDGFFFY